MIKLVLMLGVMSCWLGMAQGQEMTPSSMPDVDHSRQTPELAREREAVARYMFFWTLCERIVLLESDRQPDQPPGAVVKRLLNLMPENSAAGCPEVFRKVWLEPSEKIKTALNKNEEWAETPEGKKQMEAMEKAVKCLEEPYGVTQMVRLSREWLNNRLGFRKEDSPEKVLKDVLQLKSDVESGKVAVPVEYLRAGVDGNTVD